MSLSHEVPARLRRLPRGRVAVRVTPTAAVALSLDAADIGWVMWRTQYARRIAVLCRYACAPKKRGDDDGYSGAEKLAMRRLAEQIEARLAP